MQVNYGDNEIKDLLEKVRVFNTDIGTHQLFTVNDNFDYVVKLSNGTIKLTLEELQDSNFLSQEQLEEIAKRFRKSTTVVEKKNTLEKPTTKKEPKKKTSGFITIIALGLILFLAYVFINSKDNSSSSSSDSYQERVMSVEEIERLQPLNFLSADGTYRENFWGNKFKVSCTITNKATVVTYKDVVVRVTYYSKTHTVLGSNDYTIYEVFQPNSTRSVELKIDNYKDVSSIGWDVIRAGVM